MSTPPPPVESAREIAKENPSLRDAHKRRTRRALRAAAIKLFTRQGFDATTTEEIAEEAQVSTRTFFRYFATKESVLFLGERTWADTFAEIYVRQPATLRDVDALRAALVELAGDLPRSRQAAFDYEQIVASSATLRGREHDFQQTNAEKIAEAIARRRGLPAPDAGCRLLGGMSVLVYRMAIDTWLAGPDDSPFAGVVDDLLGLLAGQYEEPRRRTRRKADNDPDPA